MNIVGVSAEIAPWSKAGGLGEVAGALPVALAARGHRVMTVSGRYKPYDDAWSTGVQSSFHLFGQMHTVTYHHAKVAGVDRVFVDHPAIQRGGVYGDNTGGYGDNQFRFALLCRAAIEAPRLLPLDGSTYGEDVVFWANDWHGALVPVYLKALYRNVGLFLRAPVLLGLHNLAHQGTYAAESFDGLDLSGRWYPALDMSGVLNTLKGGLVTAERIVTVSPNYASEIRTTEGGWGLDGVLRARAEAISGVINGIDIAEWDPTQDKHLPAHFSATDLSGKGACKAALQRELGLPVRTDVPLLGFVGRLDYQKGVDLIKSVMPWLMSNNVQIVLLGSGSPQLETFLRESERVWPHAARGWVGFSTPMAHKVVAASDILLMPSRFEPCGLSQLHALRYGTVPVVHATGGLKDTVEHYNPFRHTGTGWTFGEATPEALAEATAYAVRTWKQFPEAWAGLQQRGMAVDVSWAKSAATYEALFEAAVAGMG